MAYELTLEDMKEADEQEEASKKKGFRPTGKDFQEWDKKIASDNIKRSLMSPGDVKLHDVTAGIVNPWINMLNLIPKVDIPTMDVYQPLSKAALAGSIAGGVAPFLTGEGAIAKGAAQIPRALEALRASPQLLSKAQKVARLAATPSPMRSALVGGGVGAATSPTGERGINAALGSLGAGIMHGAGLGLGKTLSSLKSVPVIKKAAQAFEPPLSANLPESSAQEATDYIAQNYVKARKTAEDMYNNATVAADLKNIAFNKEDFPNYNKEYARQLADKELPERNIKSPEELIAPATTPEEISSLILPEDLKKELSQQAPLQKLKPSQVHRERSKLLALGRGSRSGFDKKSFNSLASALNRDYLKKMDAIDPRYGNAYVDANNFYRDTIKNKFGNHEAFKKMRNAITVYPGHSEDINDLYRIDWHGKNPKSLINNLVPRQKDTGMETLQSFQNDLMGGDKEKTAEIAKNLMFSKYASPLNGAATAEEIETPNYKFNMYKFLKHYDGLGDSQKNYLFNKEEQNTLNTLAKHANKLKKPGVLQDLAKKALGASLGYITAAHTVGTAPAKIMGELAGAALASPVEQAAQSTAKAFLPSSLEKLLPKLEPHQPSFRSTRLPAIAAVSLLPQLQSLGGGYNAR